MVSVQARLHPMLLLPLAVVACTAAPPRSHATHISGDRYLDQPYLPRTSEPPCGSTFDQDGDGKTDVTTQYTYDGHGRLVGVVAIDAAGVQLRQEERTYDNAGHVDTDIVTEPGSRTRTYSSYNPLGQLREITSYIVRPPPLPDIVANTGYGDLTPTTTVVVASTMPVGGTERTVKRFYTLDDLGRWINREVDEGDVVLSTERAVFDDDARTVTFTLNTPPTADQPVGEDLVAVDSYDADYNYVASHSTDTFSDGTTEVRDDMVVRDATREIYESTTDTRTTTDKATGKTTSVVTTTNLTYSYTGCH